MKTTKLWLLFLVMVGSLDSNIFPLKSENPEEALNDSLVKNPLYFDKKNIEGYAAAKQRLPLIRLHVWFDRQLCFEPEQYQRLCRQWSDHKRRSLRKRVIQTLKDFSRQSLAQAQPALDDLKTAGVIKSLKPTWVVNGFYCTLKPEDAPQLKTIPGVSRIVGAPHPSSIHPSIGYQNYLSTNSDEGPWLPLKSSWNVIDIKARAVWEELGFTGKGIICALSDISVRLDHPDLEPHLWKNPDEIPNNQRDDDGNGYVDDIHGWNFRTDSHELHENNFPKSHGTMCAGVILGSRTGLAPASRLMVLYGKGLRALEYALDENADIMTMSYSGGYLGEFRSTLRLAHEHATLAGMVCVSGAGNWASGPRFRPVPEQMSVPEDIPCVITVAGVFQDRSRYPASSQGPVVWDTDWYQDFPEEKPLMKPDVVALVGGYPFLHDGKVLDMYSSVGNSYSGPHAAGVAALMLEADPDCPAWVIRDLMMETAEDVLAPGHDPQSGRGLINALKAVEAVLERRRNLP